MTIAEKQLLLSALNDGRQALAKALEGLEEAVAARRPGGGGWSILECVEHMCQSEQYLLSRLRMAASTAQPVATLAREEKIARRARDRSRPIEAPSMVRPRGRFSTLRDALAAFDGVRAEVIDYVVRSSGDLRCQATDHPLIQGPVSCYETLLMIAAHPRRHAEQILELRASFARTNGPGDVPGDSAREPADHPHPDPH
jgi:DinB superfamily